MLARRAWLVVVAVACHRAPSHGRERVLDQIPADAVTVLAADGPALAHARLRPVIDALRPYVPPGFGCVVDAAIASRHVAIGVAADRGVTIAIDTRARVTCRALSRVGELWIATLGRGEPAGGDSVLAAPELARARPYLLSAPIAFARAGGGAAGALLATAQPEPLEAWLAYDSTDTAAIAAEGQARALLARMTKDPATAPFAAQLSIARDGPQLVARLAGPVAADLALAVRAVLRWRGLGEDAARRDLRCPRPLPAQLVSCDDASRTFVVRELRLVLEALADTRVEPVISGGAMVGLRLELDVPLLDLRRGDVVAGIDGRTVSSRIDLTTVKDGAPVDLLVRRGTTEATLHLRPETR